VLVVTFGTPGETYSTRIKRIPGIGGRWNDGVICHNRWYSPGEHFTGSQLIDDLVTFIHEARRRGKRIERIMFDEIDVALDSLPSLKEDLLFWPTLVEFLEAEGITAVFIADGSELQPHLRVLNVNADYAFIIEPDGGEFIRISVERDGGQWLGGGIRKGKVPLDFVTAVAT